MSRVSGEDLRNYVDFVLQFSQEKKPGNGEDANVYSLNIEEVLIGAFDGCGGAGARQHPSVRNKTSAYLASRIVSGAVRDWFADPDRSMAVENVRSRICSQLYTCFSCSDMRKEPSPRMINKLAKMLPSTAAFAVGREKNGTILADCYWAGDSRLYLLDEDGLAQISVDDLNVTDAMENLYIGGKMTNVVHLSMNDEKGFQIHHSQLRLTKSGLLFAATDGCFDYLTSPMEFEYLLLETLRRSKSVNEWEQYLKAEIGRIAQDDSSMTAVAFGYGNFLKLKNSFAHRTQYLYDYYISGLNDKEKEEKTQLWCQYRRGYYRL